MSPVFSDDDRQEHKRRNEILYGKGTAEERAAMARLTHGLMKDFKDRARQEMRARGEVTRVLGIYTPNPNEDCPFVPRGAIEDAIRPEIAREFEIAEDAFTIERAEVREGLIHKPGTYDTCYNVLEIFVRFDPPLK